MASEKTLNVTPGRYNDNKPGTTGSKGKLGKEIVIVREETVVMTAAQFDNAVEALAVLILRHHETTRPDPQPGRDRLALAA
jgi:hypothetical protein